MRERLHIHWREISLVVGILVIAAGLRLWNLAELSTNPYYTATVRSMLDSWHNWFFGAAEPGGSVTVDKPPLGFWLQTLSASVFGFHDWALILPQALAGIGSVALVYLLVRQVYDIPAAAIAALALAVMPVVVATERNNTIDGTLLFVLLLATWSTWKALEQPRWLLMTGLLIGIGFNIKMLQAFLPVPALYALFWLGSRSSWSIRLRTMALSGMVLAVVGLSWAVVVDLTPAEQRPYVGSSQTNSVLELMFGYNGIQRLTGGATPVAASSSFMNGGLGAMTLSEAGEPGLLRLFQDPLMKEVSWLLLPALLALIMIFVVQKPRRTLSPQQLGAVVWGGWLITGAIFFSIAQFVHAYYLNMLGPPIAALTGILWWSIQRLERRQQIASAAVVLGTTLAFQWWAANTFDQAGWLPVALVLAVAGLGVLVWQRRLQTLGWSLMAASLLVAPGIWSSLTIQHNPNAMLPAAYGSAAFPSIPAGMFGADNSPPDMSALRPPGSTDSDSAMPFPAFGAADDAMPPLGQMPPSGFPFGGGSGGMPQLVNPELLAYLQTHTQDTTYLVAVPNALIGSSLIIETGRPVLLMGGFSGQDPVVDESQLSSLVANNDLRYVLEPGGNFGFTRPEISAWLKQHCEPVDLPQSMQFALPFAMGDAGPQMTLYACGEARS